MYLLAEYNVPGQCTIHGMPKGPYRLHFLIYYLLDFQLCKIAILWSKCLFLNLKNTQNLIHSPKRVLLVYKR